MNQNKAKSKAAIKLLASVSHSIHFGVDKIVSATDYNYGASNGWKVHTTSGTRAVTWISDTISIQKTLETLLGWFILMS